MSSEPPMEPLQPPRPMFIDIEPRASSPFGTLGVSWPNSSAERVQYYPGDVPPSLSPLDAFAAHSRKLAKALDEETEAGERRVSRLPPHVITKSLNEHQANRPHYFRSLSGRSSPGDSPSPHESSKSGISPSVLQPKTRPTSSYPRITQLASELEDSQGSQKAEETFVTPREIPSVHIDLPRPSTDYFNIPRAQSPEVVEASVASGALQGGTQTEDETPQTSFDRPKPTAMSSDVTFVLAPPNAPFAHANHHRLHAETSDDDYPSSNAGSTFSLARKLSSSSGMSRPRTPVSPFVAQHGRSLSATSGKSSSSTKASRSHLNFSRPISAASSHHHGETPSRQRSKGSQLSQPSVNSLDLPRTPLSFDECRSNLSDDMYASPTSYTLGTYHLPRGRMDGQQSGLFPGASTPPLEWQLPEFAEPSPLIATQADGMLSLASTALRRPGQDSESEIRPTGFSFDLSSERSRNYERPGRPTTPHSASNSINGTTSFAPRPSTSHAPVSKPLILPPIPTIPSEAPSLSSRSNSTIRPTTARSQSKYQSLSADEHVSKAIDLHQHGDLKESTYHLRIAARQDHPTGMLLYALACRHGWGIRPNPAEGVQWLRKAMDSAMLEVADDENPMSETGSKDVIEKKTHRAQFALSIYELGVSHLNGWGTEQDKPLALRCFEIAGEWGDTDALTEAGFCYSQGIGCKKDLRKAAKFYRRAAEKGVSMVGNSWIYKDKYNDVEPERTGRDAGKRNTDASPKKKRDKSKTRSIFSRRKSVTARDAPATVASIMPIR